MNDGHISGVSVDKSEVKDADELSVKLMTLHSEEAKDSEQLQVRSVMYSKQDAGNSVSMFL